MKLEENKKISHYIFIYIIISFLILAVKGLEINTDKRDISNDSFYIEYYNDSEANQKIRYKYIMNYKVENIEDLKNIDFNKPLFTLKHDNMVVYDKFPSFTEKPLLPEISKSTKIKKDEITKSNFEIIYNEELSIRDKNKIRFEVYVYIEQLYKGKWETIYETQLLKRGPNWSLSKHPRY